MKENAPEQLKALQTAFASHIRDPERSAAPANVENRRMKIYRELFFNNIQSLLASNFPVLHKIYTDEEWRRLVRDFYSEHRCQTPLFTEVAKEFLRYLQDEREPRAEDPGFLHELAHYEWVELALSLDERELDEVSADSSGNLLHGIPVLSPLAWPLTYRYPVHLISPEYQPADAPAEPTHVLVYRDRGDKVRFMKLNAVSQLLLAFLQEETNLTGMQLLTKIAGVISHPEPDRVVETGARLLEDLKNRNVLLGTRKNPNA